MAAHRLETREKTNGTIRKNVEEIAIADLFEDICS